MILRDIALYLDNDQYERDRIVSFGFHARYVCNYLRRRLRVLKFDAAGFSRIVVRGCREEQDACPIQGESAAVPGILFDKDAYESLGPGQRHEFFISMLLRGLRKCARFHCIPLAELELAIEDFRRGGYRNEWTHKRRSFPKLGVRASLLCSMDSEKFVLTLSVECRGRNPFVRQILQTKPDETIFAHRFKDVVVRDGKVVVIDLFNKPAYTLDLESLTPTE